MASATRFLTVMATVLLSASITVVASERIFWFWTPALAEHLVLATFYAVPIGATLWAIDRYQVDSAWSLLLATPIYAYLIEGLITPILYTGGPFVPFFPAWFAAWHGMLGFFVLWFVVRRLLLAEAWRPLLALSAALGLFWGVWASTMRLPESAEDPDLIAEGIELVVLVPEAFAVYVTTFTLVLAVSHWLLGYVWPTHFAVPRWVARVVGSAILIGVTAWTVVVPWALPMFLAYVALQRWGLRRHHSSALPDGARTDLFGQMAGRIRLRALWPVAAIVPAAAWTYWLLWVLAPSDGVLTVVMYSVIAVQTVIGGWFTIAALRRMRRSAGSLLEGADAALGQVSVS